MLTCYHRQVPLGLLWRPITPHGACSYETYSWSSARWEALDRFVWYRDLHKGEVWFRRAQEELAGRPDGSLLVIWDILHQIGLIWSPGDGEVSFPDPPLEPQFRKHPGWPPALSLLNPVSRVSRTLWERLTEADSV